MRRRLVALVAATLVAASVVVAQPADGIYNGQDANVTAFPWLVSLHTSPDGGATWDHKCGGSLVAPQWILTAAHCMYASQEVRRAPRDVRAFVGVDSINGVWDLSTSKAIEQVVLLPRADGTPAFEPVANWTGDLALLRLSNPAYGVPTIELADGEPTIGTALTAVGWGSTTDDWLQLAPPDQLQQLDHVRVKSDNSCWNGNIPYEPGTPSAQLCTKADPGILTTGGVRKNDSGGPLLLWENGRWIQQGVASHFPQQGSDPNYMGWMSVSEVRDWITRTIGGESVTAESVAGAAWVDQGTGSWSLEGNDAFGRFDYWDSNGRFWYMTGRPYDAPRSVSGSGSYTPADLSGLPPGDVIWGGLMAIDYPTGDIFAIRSDSSGLGEHHLSRLNAQGFPIWTRSTSIAGGGGLAHLGALADGNLLGHYYYSNNAYFALSSIDPSTGETNWIRQLSGRDYKPYDNGFVSIGWGLAPTYINIDGTLGQTFALDQPPQGSSWGRWKTGASGDTWVMTEPNSIADCALASVQVVQPETGAGSIVAGLEDRLGFCPEDILVAPGRTAVLIGRDDRGAGIAGKIDSDGHVLWSGKIVSVPTGRLTTSIDHNGNLLTISANGASRDVGFYGSPLTCDVEIVSGCSRGRYSLVSGESGSIMTEHDVVTGYYSNGPDTFGGSTIPYSDGVVFDVLGRGVARIELPGIGRPYPLSRYRVGEPVRPSDVNGDGSVRVAVLGDSYISGEGLTPPASDVFGDPVSGYDPFTDGVLNNCHRSRTSWAVRAAQAAGAVGSNLLFAACSGATTLDVTTVGQMPGSPHGVHGGSPQVDVLADFARDGAVDVVLVSVGGNDVGFADQVKSCLLSFYECHPEYEPMLQGTVSGIQLNVRDTLRRIGMSAPGAKIVIVGYPDPIPAAGETCTAAPHLTPDEKIRLKTYLSLLNTSVAAAAADVGAHYLDISNVLADKGLCSGFGYINELRGGTEEYDWMRALDPIKRLKAASIGNESFHPTDEGHAYIYEQLTPELNALLPTANPSHDPILIVPTSPIAGRFFADPAAPGTVIQYHPNRNELVQIATFSIPTVLAEFQTTAGVPVEFEPKLPPTLAPGLHMLEARSVTTGELRGTFWYNAVDPSNCATSAPPGDIDGDDYPDACDLDNTDGPLADYDGDGVLNSTDNCVAVANANQLDSTGAGKGDACNPALGVPIATTYRSVEDTLIPGPPATAAATAGNAKATVTWQRPVVDWNKPITGYTVTASPGGRTCSTSGATTCVVTSLTNGVAYTFSVIATNAAGDSPAAVSSPAIPAGPPGAPRQVTAIAGDRSAMVSWTPPASTSGAPITGYVVTATPGGRSCTTSGPTSCPVDGLTNSVEYTFTVTATNSAGSSGASDPSAPVRPRTPAPPGGSGFGSLVPARLMDSRSANATVDGLFSGQGQRGAGSVTAVQVAGRGGVPTGAAAAVLNVTAVDTAEDGFMTVFPCDQQRPNASNLNFVAGQIIPNTVVAKLSATGTVCVYTHAATSLVIDVNGHFTT